MKNLITFLSLTLLVNLVHGQSIIAETYIEQTSTSPKIGTALGYKFNGNFEVGGFIQQSTVQFQVEDGRPLQYENEFAGAFFSYPVLNTYRTELQMKVRTGVTNGENFTITPSFHATYKPAQMITLGTGVGVRSFRPTFMASIQINLFGRKNQQMLATLD